MSISNAKKKVFLKGLNKVVGTDVQNYEDYFIFFTHWRILHY